MKGVLVPAPGLENVETSAPLCKTMREKVIHKQMVPGSDFDLESKAKLYKSSFPPPVNLQGGDVPL